MSGFRKILVPVDFSTHSSRALQTAIESLRIPRQKMSPDSTTAPNLAATVDALVVVFTDVVRSLPPGAIWF